MKNPLFIILFINVLLGQQNEPNEIGRQLWTLIFLVLTFRGAKKIGRWKGTDGRKNIYRISLPILSFFITLFLGAIRGVQPVFDLPLFYFLVINGILHISLKNYAANWISNGVLPISENYQEIIKVRKFGLFDLSIKTLVGVLFLFVSPFAYSNDGSTYIIIFWLGAGFIFWDLYSLRKNKNKKISINEEEE